MMDRRVITVPAIFVAGASASVFVYSTIINIALLEMREDRNIKDVSVEFSERLSEKASKISSKSGFKLFPANILLGFSSRVARKIHSLEKTLEKG
jgi:hypothetical protein